MNDLLTVTDELLDEMFSHEAGCEANHDNNDNLVCSGPVTHHYRTICGVDKLVCSNSARRTLRLINEPRWMCECFRHVCDCWSVIPV